MSIKIIFKRYMKWARVMSPVVFEEFKLSWDSFTICVFSLLLSISKRSNLRVFLVVNKIKCKRGRNNNKLKSRCGFLPNNSPLSAIMCRRPLM